MKRLLIALIMWFIVCAIVGIAWHKAFSYTFEGAFDPQTLNTWEVVPEFSNPPQMLMLKNPDCTADIKLALVILVHFPVMTGNGMEIKSMIYKYCYFKDGEVHFFVFDRDNQAYGVDQNITPEIREGIKNLFRQALNGKEARGGPWQRIA